MTEAKKQFAKDYFDRKGEFAGGTEITKTVEVPDGKGGTKEVIVGTGDVLGAGEFLPEGEELVTLEDMLKEQRDTAIDAGITAADEEPTPSGDGPQVVDAGTADVQDYADIYEPPSYSPPSPQGNGGGNQGGNTGSGGWGGGSWGPDPGGSYHWAKGGRVRYSEGGIVSLKNAKR